jgi:hypothetical protein
MFMCQCIRIIIGDEGVLILFNVWYERSCHLEESSSESWRKVRVALGAADGAVHIWRCPPTMGGIVGTTHDASTGMLACGAWVNKATSACT